MEYFAESAVNQFIAGILCDIAADELAVHTDGGAGYLEYLYGELYLFCETCRTD